MERYPSLLQLRAMIGRRSYCHGISGYLSEDNLEMEQLCSSKSFIGVAAASCCDWRDHTRERCL